MGAPGDVKRDAGVATLDELFLRLARPGAA
jgi:hypothetical protein